MSYAGIRRMIFFKDFLNSIIIGFEYNERGYGGGFDAFGGFAGGMDMGGGFMNEGEGKKSSEKKVGYVFVYFIRFILFLAFS